MSYDYRTRLKTGGKRFSEVNTEEVDYIRLDGTTLHAIPCSPILHKPLLIDPGGSQTRVEKQRFVFNLSDLYQQGTFFPERGDLIVRSIDNSEYEVIPEDIDSPAYEHLTSDRTSEGGRIIVNTQRIVKGAPIY